MNLLHALSHVVAVLPLVIHEVVGVNAHLPRCSSPTALRCCGSPLGMNGVGQVALTKLVDQTVHALVDVLARATLVLEVVCEQANFAVARLVDGRVGQLVRLAVIPAGDEAELSPVELVQRRLRKVAVPRQQRVLSLPVAAALPQRQLAVHLHADVSNVQAQGESETAH